MIKAIIRIRLKLKQKIKYHDYRIKEFSQKLTEAGLYEFISKLENILDSTLKNIDL